MLKPSQNHRQWSLLIFLFFFASSVAVGIALSIASPVEAAPVSQTDGITYAGSQTCKLCHDPIHSDWTSTRHAHAFSSPIFQRDWSELSRQTQCLECHTTGYDSTTGQYTEEGVSCEACHGPFQPKHPAENMSITPNAELCAKCHKPTTDEWRASPHNAAGIQCQACHNPHAQTPMAATVTELCGNCHKDRGDSFTHGTHANAGLECSNCHMYTTPLTSDPIGGLVPTGHTFSVGSDACIGCHKETVHTRDEIIKLTGEVAHQEEITVSDLQQTIEDQDKAINSLKASSSVRLYTGLVQGAIVGLVTGGAAAWVVSKRIRLVEVDEND